MKDNVTPAATPSPDEGQHTGLTEAKDGVTENPLFDPERACRQLGIAPSSFARIFDCIWTEVITRRSLLEKAFQVGDFPRVALHAHTIKTSAATIGAEGLRRAAEAMERAADAGDALALSEALAVFRRAKETLSNLLGMR